ncbi:hypothetical protein [Polyangium spumosum]|uniref:Uncharacterized protein n=1 Tax=Polyangium spumosum TaxID=889282 RepID=A0A6N7PRZ4_9BACT|nr:hypothetical protein [Polyangium spumosum]MRG94417.1 hypothetical protein [Polyangium spumosum]
MASGLLASGCGLVKVNTNIPGLEGLNTSGGGSETPSVGPLGGLPYDEDEVGKAVLATFKSWDYTSCENAECVNAFKKKAGVTDYKDKGGYIYQFNPRRTLKNPDPTWLTGWDKMSDDEKFNTADETYQALIVAASRRTWLAKCHADYAALDKELRANDTKWASEIEQASKIPSPYKRIGALLDLEQMADKNARASNQYLDNLMNNVGFRRDLRVALKAAYDSTGRDYLYAIEGRAPRGDEVRARLDPTTERDLYCIRAAGYGTPKTPEFKGAPAGNAYTERGAKYVKPLFSEETRKKLDGLREKEARKSIEEVRPGKFSQVYISTVAKGEGEIAGHPKLGYYGGFGEVKKVTQNGGKTELEIVQNSSNEYPYNCVETNKIHSIQNGRIVYREICQWGKKIHDTTVRLTLGELPEGVKIQVGDKVEGYTIVQKHEEKKLADTQALKKSSELWVLELEHLSKVLRKEKGKDKVVGRWF